MPVLYTDGQSIGNEQRQQSRKAKIAFVYQRSESGTPPPQDLRVYFKDIGDKTNNEAEYHALLAALWYISNKLTPKGLKAPSTRIFSDSKLVVGQVNGDWKVENPRLRQLQQKVVKVIVELQLPRLVWVPREQNYAGHWLEGRLRVPGEVITWNYY